MLFQLHHFPQDRGGGGGAELSVLRLHGSLSFIAEELQHFFEIFQIQQRQVVILTVFKNDGYDPALGVIQRQNPAEKHRAELRDSSPQARAFFTGKRQELYRITDRMPGNADFSASFRDFWIIRAGHSQAR